LQTSLAAGTALTLTGGSPTSGDATQTATPAQQAANPAVRPGRVRWHDDFAAACAASGRSGKPVFLFHMMGRLDQRFC
jgi:hypothetical protein